MQLPDCHWKTGVVKLKIKIPMKTYSNFLYSFLMLVVLLFPALSFGQGVGAPEPAADNATYVSLLNNYLLAAVAAVMLGALAVMVYLYNSISWNIRRTLAEQKGIPVSELDMEADATPGIFSKISLKLTDAVPIAKEQDIMFDHEVDGIRELDNKLPPWWVWLFVVTIIWSVIYFYYYHMSDMGTDQIEQYNQEVKDAKYAVAAYLAAQPDKTDETNVKQSTNSADLSAGKSLYTSNCATCHGAAGQGGAGPNLTDEYWIHGGGVQNIFKTIKYGVVEKGMQPWGKVFKGSDMAKIASYVMALEGTKPAGGLPPQGEIWKGDAAGAPASDAAAAPADSTATQ
jgi:cytochrome c oxidase cbb3-type subunit 3